MFDRDCHMGVTAAFSLADKALWSQVSAVVLEDVADYLQAPAFDAPVVLVPMGQLSGGATVCSTNGSEIFVCGSSKLAVYRDGVLQRYIGDGVSPLYGCAVVDALVYVTTNRDTYRDSCVDVYAASGGERLARLCLPSDFRAPWGVAVDSGGGERRMLVTDNGRNSVTAFSTDGAIAGDSVVVPSRRQAEMWYPKGIVLDGGKAFVAEFVTGMVAVLNAQTLDIERRIGVTVLAQAADVSLADGLLFVSDCNRVAVFDVADGHLVASIGFHGTPYGVTVVGGSTLVVTVQLEHIPYQRGMYAVSL